MVAPPPQVAGRSEVEQQALVASLESVAPSEAVGKWAVAESWVTGVPSPQVVHSSEEAVRSVLVALQPAPVPAEAHCSR
jgi:hypothetical protein